MNSLKVFKDAFQVASISVGGYAGDGGVASLFKDSEPYKKASRQVAEAQESPAILSLIQAMFNKSPSVEDRKVKVGEKLSKLPNDAVPQALLDLAGTMIG